MQNFKRKQFILPQKMLNQAKRALHAKTETEAVILSLQAVLKQKKLEAFKELPSKIKFTLTSKELERMRRD